MKKLLKITLTLFLTAIIVLGFALPLNPVGNWYQQFFPDLGGRQINDITFTDSLNGYAVTNKLSLQDTNIILKTTTGGNSWFFCFKDSNVTYNAIQFINQNTGFVCGRINKSNTFKIVKTTNAGINWFYINAPFDLTSNDMHALNEDTIWLASDNITTGGVFRTTNGGVNWQVQYQIEKALRIYMYDRDLGFFSTPNFSAIFRTTNSGTNWTQVTGETGFRDIYFVDSQTGWKANGPIKKTTNGGLNWVQQTLPSGGIFTFTGAGKISVLNIDTIWAVGGAVQYPSLQSRGVIYRTTNGGDTWLFQVPDTAISSNTYYSFIQFINARVGWAHTQWLGVHTTTGGDTTWLTPVNQVSSEVPKEYHLFQNYPNPFNPKTIIRFQINKLSNVKIVVHDITGKETAILVNERQNSGTYETEFNGSGYSSGIYFYSLIIDNKIIETRKMILLK